MAALSLTVAVTGKNEVDGAHMGQMWALGPLQPPLRPPAHALPSLFNHCLPGLRSPLGVFPEVCQRLHVSRGLYIPYHELAKLGLGTICHRAVITLLLCSPSPFHPSLPAPILHTISVLAVSMNLLWLCSVCPF